MGGRYRVRAAGLAGMIVMVFRAGSICRPDRIA
jgi:hypothetical protein